jgi:hypothetical protein
MNAALSIKEYSLHGGLQAAKGLVQILEAMSRDGKVVLGNMTLRQGRKRIKLEASGYFRLALSALDECLDLHRPDASAAVRERY